MDPEYYSDSEVQELVGKDVQMIAEGGYVPRGTRGKVSGRRSTGEQRFAALVNWEVNPMFITATPRQTMHSKAEFSKVIRVIG